MGTLSKVSQAQENVGETVPRIPQFNHTAKRLANDAPIDRVSVCHGDYKMDNCKFTTVHYSKLINN